MERRSHQSLSEDFIIGAMAMVLAVAAGAICGMTAEFLFGCTEKYPQYSVPGAEKQLMLIYEQHREYQSGSELVEDIPDR